MSSSLVETYAVALTKDISLFTAGWKLNDGWNALNVAFKRDCVV
jgi:hypothetical protein